MIKAVILASILALPAAAQDGAYGENDRPTWDPPARYQGEYLGTLVEKSLPQPEVQRLCSYLGVVSPHTRGCVQRVGKTCILIRVSTQYGASLPEAVRRHEMGHCLGWPSDHPA
jgi:hypothetical protein